MNSTAKRFSAIILSLGMACALFALPVHAEGDEDSPSVNTEMSDPIATTAPADHEDGSYDLHFDDDKNLSLSHPEETQAPEENIQTVPKFSIKGLLRRVTGGVVASGYCGDTDNGKDGKNISWTLTSDGTLTLSGTGEMAFYNDSKRTIFGWNGVVAPWYDQSHDVKKVVIGNGITKIGSAAFYNTDITSVELPSSVTTISQIAFENCSKLTSIKLNEGLKTIGMGAFKGTALEKVEVPSTVEDISSTCLENLPVSAWDFSRNKRYSKKDCMIFSDGGRTLAFVDRNAEGTVTIPEGVEVVADSAARNVNVSNFIFPSTLKVIKDYGFYFDRQLESAVLPESVESIGICAFCDCPKLTKAYVPGKVKKLNSAFLYDSGLTDLTLSEGLEELDDTFRLCSGLTKITLPSTVRKIERDTFAGCEKLQSITIPEGVEELPYQCFAQCYALSDVQLPNTLKKLANRSFGRCFKMKTITLPDSVEEVEAGAFDQDEGIQIIASPFLKKMDDGSMKSIKAISDVRLNVTYDQTAARSMLDNINAFRTGSEAWHYDQNNNKVSDAGLSKLVYDYSLEKTAMQRAADIVATFEHTRPNGDDCFTVFPSGYSAKGENIAMGYWNVESVMNGWKETNQNYDGQGHRRNMLSSGFNAVGIARVKYKGTNYWVQDFGYKETPDTNPTAAVNETRSVSWILSNNILQADKTDMSQDDIILNQAGAKENLGYISHTNVRSNSNSTIDFNFRDADVVPFWAAEDSTVVSVENNQAKALKNNSKTKLSGFALGKDYQVNVVTGPDFPVDSISLNQNQGLLSQGGTETLKAVIEPSYASRNKITWQSSNPSIATVDEQGHVTGINKGQVTISATAGGKTASCTFEVVDPLDNAHVNYTTHVQNIGTQAYVRDGEMAGTSGRSLRLEGMWINVVDGNGNRIPGIEYKTHVQNIGWQDWVRDDQMAGTTGQSLRLEAMQVRLTGILAEKYDVYYRVHAQNFGWMNWAKNGEMAGTAHFSYRLEAMQIKLVKKGNPAPESSPANAVSYSFRDADAARVMYTPHVQNIGTQAYAKDGEMAGTTGRSLRLEGIWIKKGSETAGLSGDIEYRTHIQNIGWENNWKRNDEMSGTAGRALRLEAIQIRLTGQLAEKYDVYYRVHAENFGWMGWAMNGERAGTAGYAYRLEGINIVLVPKGGSAPGSTYRPFSEYVSPSSYSQPTRTEVIYYWTPGGGKYHQTKDCPSLGRSRTILSGTLEEAKQAGKYEPCKDCFH